ncbi:hypothetical protein BsIDN1_00540 [Bacillus safensis]|uniref:Uncharacterized protein n=1 Tax=Bacillus safensis TaxID=561879 RepID=A0A5S9M4K8_BACIA|nr:hypothetical protein BsIDN1_00540 [Bacillus safensis]
MKLKINKNEREWCSYARWNGKYAKNDETNAKNAKKDMAKAQEELAEKSP